MGLNNDAQLIVGCSIEPEIIEQIEQRLFEQTSNEYNLREMTRNLEELPYFDCPEEDRWWYLSVNSRNGIKLSDLGDHTEEWKRFHETFGLNVPDMMVIAVPDIW